jgi:hypothetical protein
VRQPPHTFMEPPRLLASVASSRCPSALSRQVVLLWRVLIVLLCVNQYLRWRGVVAVVVGVMVGTLVAAVVTDAVGVTVT